VSRPTRRHLELVTSAEDDGGFFSSYLVLLVWGCEGEGELLVGGWMGGNSAVVVVSPSWIWI
jgi:hypothetical protein